MNLEFTSPVRCDLKKKSEKRDREGKTGREKDEQDTTPPPVAAETPSSFAAEILPVEGFVRSVVAYALTES